ncbi:MAG TPA: hypothetical protein PKZ97_02905 [Azospirillaceae bacterium]|nr:hypothetical protein [Azospirillaceae bacterium]
MQALTFDLDSPDGAKAAAAQFRRVALSLRRDIRRAPAGSALRRRMTDGAGKLDRAARCIERAVSPNGVRPADFRRIVASANKAFNEVFAAQELWAENFGGEG